MLNGSNRGMEHENMTMSGGASLCVGGLQLEKNGFLLGHNDH